MVVSKVRNSTNFADMAVVMACRRPAQNTTNLCGETFQASAEQNALGQAVSVHAPPRIMRSR